MSIRDTVDDITERWCRNAFWLETHRACCQILYKTKTMYFYEALEQTRVGHHMIKT